MTTTSVSLLMIGSELLDGRVLDTNKQRVSQSISDLGLSISGEITVVDNIEDIAEALGYLFQRSRFVICSGGLGPTSDDLTREAIAKYFQKEIFLDNNALRELKELYKRRQRSFDDSNIKQATFPVGATIITNPVGTAAGFYFKDEKQGKIVYALPGVPKELEAMLAESVIPQILSECYQFIPIQKKYLRLFGIPESVVGSKISSLNLPDDVEISYLAAFPEVKVTLKSKRELKKELTRIKSTLGEDHIFSEDINIGLEETVHNLMIDKKITVAVAESCTGGLLGSYMTQKGGSSDYFIGGIIAYSNEVKVRELNIPESTIEQKGAVSHEVALLMAKNIREKYQSSVGISITGIAGPEGGSPAKPVGTFFVGISYGSCAKSYKFLFVSARDFIRRYSGYKALDLLRRTVLALPDPVDSLDIFTFN